MNQEELIIHLYCVEKKSLNAISKQLHCEKARASRILKARGIQITGTPTHVSKRPTEQEINNFKKLFNEGKNAPAIAKETGWAFPTVCRYLGDLFKGSTPNLEETEIKEIQELYNQDLSSREVAKRLGISKTTVLKFIDNSRPSSSFRIYECDKDYFSFIDHQDKAYWLGVLYADGNVGSVENTITLTSTDKEFVEKLKEALKAENPIYTRERSKDNPNWKDAYTLRVSENKLKEDLIKLGCIPNKTYSVSLPEIPDEYKSHFVRGVFDGDGSISGKPGRGFFSICGYLPFMDQLQDVIIEGTGLNKTKLAPRKENFGDIRYGGRNVIQILYNYLYTDANYYLSRKKEKFEQVLEIV